MTSAPEVITAINTLSNATYNTNLIRDCIIDGIEIIKDSIEPTEKKCLNKVIKIVSKKKYQASDKKQLNQIKSSVIGIINKYEEEYNEESNEDELDESLSVDEVEALLDKKIPSYKKFSQIHPMKGISWNETKNIYQVKICKINTTSKNLDTACRKIIENYPIEHAVLPGELYVTNHFSYHNYYFVCYWKNDEAFFDIRHIISVHNLQKTSWNDKYNEFSKYIVHYIWHPNDFGGYFLRELIPEEAMYNLAMSSNNNFSKLFRKEIAKILVNLRKQGQLKITNKKVSLKKGKAYNGMNHDGNRIVEFSNHPVYYYENQHHAQFIAHLIRLGANIAFAQFINCPVLYAAIIPIKTNHGQIIIKFGFTDDITDRMITLPKEYQCKVYFIGIKKVSKQKDEIIFHDMLKEKYSSLIEAYEYKNKNKVELYKFSPILMKQFNIYHKTTDELNPINDYIEIELNFQDNPFNPESMYEYMMLKEKNTHDKFMMSANIELHKLELEKLKHRDIDKEIQLAKLTSNGNYNRSSYSIPNYVTHTINTPSIIQCSESYTTKPKKGKSKYITTSSSDDNEPNSESTEISDDWDSSNNSNESNNSSESDCVSDSIHITPKKKTISKKSGGRNSKILKL